MHKFGLFSDHDAFSAHAQTLPDFSSSEDEKAKS